MNENKEKLQELQIEYELLMKIVLQSLKNKLPIEEKCMAKVVEIKNEMAKLNKLDAEEKNIHVVWIGIPDGDEFDNLKVWAKYNPEYKIHIWTDYTHILTHLFNKTIVFNSEVETDNGREPSYKREADIKDDFYNNYQLANPDKTFDENVKQYLLDANPNNGVVDKWIEDAKEKYLQEQADIKRYTLNEVIIHDVNEEKNNIFPSKRYYDGYLKTLEHLHLCAGASDRLRYAILNKFGGVYLDTDVAMNFNLKDINNNQEMNKLIDQIECGENWKDKKGEVILNHIILLNNLNQLNDEMLSDFANKWEATFNGSYDTNLPIFKEIGKEFKNMNLNLIPETKLANFSLGNALALGLHVKDKKICNAFIFSKKDSSLLQDVMRGIEMTDEKLKMIEIDTYTKLINKNAMIIYHTGPVNLFKTILIKDENYFTFDSKNNHKLINLENINSSCSSWFDLIPHKDAIEEEEYLSSFFYTHVDELVNINQLKEKFWKVVYKKDYPPLINVLEKEPVDFELID